MWSFHDDDKDAGTSGNTQGLLRPMLEMSTSLILQVTQLNLKSRSKKIHLAPLMGGISKLRSKRNEFGEANKQLLVQLSTY